MLSFIFQKSTTLLTFRLMVKAVTKKMRGAPALLFAASLLLVVSLYGATAWKLDKNLMAGPSRDEKDSFKASGWPVDSIPNPMTAAGAVSRLFPTLRLIGGGATTEVFRALNPHPRCPSLHSCLAKAPGLSPSKAL